MLVADGPPFGLAVSLPACLMSLAILVFQLRRFPDNSTRYVLVSMWLRYSVAMFHEITYRPIFGGLSFVAALTVALVVIGLATINLKVFRATHLRIFYAFCFVAIISGLSNFLILGLFNNFIKYAFMILMLGGAYEAMKRYGSRRFYRAVAAILMTPLVLQWLSFATDLKKISESTTETDLAISYIGGYQHQAGFAVIILTFMVAIILWRPQSMIASVVAMAITLFALILCDYRTAMIASTIPIGVFLLTKITSRFKSAERPFIMMTFAVVLLLTVTSVAILKQERFSDIGNIATKGSSLIKPPEYFTDPEQKMLSGRIHLWSSYIYEYSRSDLGAMLIGFGPDAWNGRFALYAHNNFVSYLYEYGLVGLGLFFLFVSYNIILCFKTSGVERLSLLACHVSLVVLSLGTMPMWMVEGGILYALIIARTWFGNFEWRHARNLTCETAPRAPDRFSASARPAASGSW